MNCFVIMPFAKEFDDVYTVIKTSVEQVIAPTGGRCFRLDEARPAGPITDRLLREIQAANFCVADITGNIPNVMWEVGYAMALGKPIILITQKISELPFDIKDMQSLEYDRGQISRTLSQPLQRMVLDTLHLLNAPALESNLSKEKDELVGALLAEIKDLKGIVGDAVKAWSVSQVGVRHETTDLSRLEGVWVNNQNGSHYYAKIINGELVIPYCYMGNDQLTAVYYDWKRAGDRLFARFTWIHADISGFAFFKEISLDMLNGAWWNDYEVEVTPDTPPSYEGVLFQWEKQKNIEFPDWALGFLNDVQKSGLANVVAKNK